MSSATREGVSGATHTKVELQVDKNCKIVKDNFPSHKDFGSWRSSHFESWECESYNYKQNFGSSTFDSSPFHKSGIQYVNIYEFKPLAYGATKKLPIRINFFELI